MKLSVINAGSLKLDGGAMFGIVPKPLWERLNPADELNRCTWAMRLLLIEVEDRKILIDTGIGNKQDEKFQSHFAPEGQQKLWDGLQQIQIKAEDITDVLLTHLHFDHVGGAVTKDEQENLLPSFPNATYWSNEAHYNWAFNSNFKEKASFIKENFVPLNEAGVLKFIDFPADEIEWLPGIRLKLVFGHTEAMMVPIIDTGDRSLIYCADVMPSTSHIGLPYVMGYDVRPLKTLEEKKEILEFALEHNHYLFFEHDPAIACVQLKRNQKGRIVMDKEVVV